MNLEKDRYRKSDKHEVGEDVEDTDNEQLVGGPDTTSYKSRSVSPALKDGLI